MAITLIINGVSQTVESGATVTVSPVDQIRILVDGLVIDPAAITRQVAPPDVILTLPDGQSVTLESFVDLSGQAGGGLLGTGDAVVVASTLEALTAPAASGEDDGPDTAGDNNASTFNQADPSDLGSDFGASGDGTEGAEVGTDGTDDIGTGGGDGPPAGDGVEQDPNELLTALIGDDPGGTPPTTTTTTPPPGGSAATATIPAPAPNVAPSVTADTSAVVEDSLANPVSGTVLGNDSDSDGPAALSVSQVNGLPGNVGVAVAGTFGSLTLGADGSYSYTLDNALPAVQALAQGTTVQDVFTYEAFDGLAGTTSTLTVTITGTNDAPVTVIDAGAVTEDAVPNTATGNVLANDSDLDGPAALTVSQVNGLPGNVGVPVAGTLGSLTLGADGAFTYTLDNALPAVQALAQGATVQEVFTYQAFDGLIATASALTVTVTGANDAPTGVDDDGAAFTTDEDTAFTTGSVLANDTDPDTGAVLSVAALDTTGTLGLVTNNGDGTFGYNPNGQFDSLAAGASTTDSFQYTVSDGNGGIDTATVTVTVNGVNDPPTGVDDIGTTDEDTVLNVAAATGILANDIDPDSTLTVVAVNGVAGNVGNTFTTGTGASLTVQADGSYVYDPTGSAQLQALAAGANAADSFSYTLSDGTATSTATVNLTITGVNDPPTGVNDTGMTDEDTVLNVAAAAGILSNDSDPDTGSMLTVATVNGIAGNVGNTFTTGTGASLTVQADGSYVYDPTGSAQLQALAAGANAADSFSYTLSDGTATSTATVNLTITGVNDPPTGVNDTGMTDEDTVLNVAAAAGILSNDSDPDTGSMLTVATVNGIAGNVGTTFTTGTGASLTVQADGSYVYDPTGSAQLQALAAGANAADSFSYTVSDGTATATATVNLTITGVNDPPTGVNDTGMTDEDTVLNVAAATGILSNDSDPDTGSMLTVATVNGVAGNVGNTFTTGTGASLSVQADGSYVYDPTGSAQLQALAAGANAADSFSYTVSDGTATATATVNLTITGVNDPPTGVNDTGMTDEDTVLNVAAATGILSNDSDPDTGNMLTVATVNGIAGNVGTTFTTGTGASLTVQADGSYVYDPTGSAQLQALAAGANAADSFSYTLSDGTATSTATVNLTVTGVNDAPDAVDDGGILFLTDEEMAFTTANVLTNDSDPDTGGTFSLTAVNTAGTTGIVTNNGDGTFGYDPLGFFQSLAAGTSTTDSFTYTITDDQGAADTATVTVTILGVNDAPNAVNDTGTAFTTDEDTAFTTGSVLANDTDVDNGTTLTVTGFDASGTTGQVTNNGDGTFAYNPNGQFETLNDGQSATDSFTYTISDGNGGTDTAMATITINGVSDVPSNVFFIDNAGGGTGGTGSQSDPFRTIDDFNTANGGAGLGADAIIYLRAGTYNEADGVNLNTGQMLIGQGQDLVVNGSTIETGSALQTPTISTTGGTNNGIDLASGNTIRGLDIGNTTGSGIADGGATVGALAISDVAIGGSGQAIDIDQGGTLAVTFDSISSTGSGAQGIDLQDVFGIFSVTGTTTISGTTGTSINIVNIGSGSDFDFGTTNIVNRGTTGIFIDSVADGGGTLDFGTVTDANGASATGYAIRVEDSSGAITFGAANLSNTRVGTAGTYNSTTERPTNDGDGDAVFLSNNTGSVTFSGGTIEDIADNAFDIRNSDNTVLNGVVIRDGGDANDFSTANSAIQWINSDNLSLINVNLSNIGDNTPVSTGGVNVSDDGLKAYEVGGNLIIQNSVFNTATGYVLQNATNGSENRAVELDNDLVHDLNVTVTGSTFSNWDFQGLNLRHIGGSLDAIIGGPNAADQNTFQNINGAAIDTGPAQASTGANTHGLLVQNNDFDNVGIAVSVFSGRGTGAGTQATIQDNDIDNTIADAIRLNALSSGTDGNPAIFRASVTGNTIDGVGTLAANSGGGNAFFVAAEDGADSDVTIDNNMASGGAGGGSNAQLAITTQNQRGSDLDLIFTNNSFSNFPGAVQGFGLGFFQNGSGTASSQTIRFGGNDWGGIAGGFGESIVFDSTGTSVMEVDGFTGTLSLDLHTFISTLDANLAPHSGFMIFGNAPTNGAPTVVAPTLPPLTPLLAAGGEASTFSEGVHLTRSEVEPVFDAAVQRWLSTDLTSGDIALLESADFWVGELADGVLAGAFGNRIVIDSDAAGWGWFVDRTPSEDSEFGQHSGQASLSATSTEAAAGIDLLTAVLHELGHVLGYSHEEDGLLAETLDIGVRLLPGAEHDADTASLELEDVLGSNSQEPSDPGSPGTWSEFEGESTVNHAHNPMLPSLEQLPYETGIVA